MKEIRFWTTTAGLALTLQFHAQCFFSDKYYVHAHLEGGWALYKRCGGLQGGCITPSQLGYRPELRFAVINYYSDSISCSYFENSVKKSSGTVPITFSSQQPTGWDLGPIPMFRNVALRMTYCPTDTLVLDERAADGFQYYFVRNSTVNLHEISSNSSFLIFPVPATSEISSPVFRSATHIEIYDANGKLVMMSAGASESGAIDISVLQNGLYQIFVSMVEQKFQARFIKTSGK